MKTEPCVGNEKATRYPGKDTVGRSLKVDDRLAIRFPQRQSPGDHYRCHTPGKPGAKVCIYRSYRKGQDE